MPRCRLKAALATTIFVAYLGRLWARSKVTMFSNTVHFLAGILSPKMYNILSTNTTQLLVLAIRMEQYCIGHKFVFQISLQKSPGMVTNVMLLWNTLPWWHNYVCLRISCAVRHVSWDWFRLEMCEHRLRLTGDITDCPSVVSAPKNTRHFSWSSFDLIVEFNPVNSIPLFWNWILCRESDALWMAPDGAYPQKFQSDVVLLGNAAPPDGWLRSAHVETPSFSGFSSIWWLTHIREFHSPPRADFRPSCWLDMYTHVTCAICMPFWNLKLDE